MGRDRERESESNIVNTICDTILNMCFLIVYVRGGTLKHFFSKMEDTNSKN